MNKLVCRAHIAEKAGDCDQMVKIIKEMIYLDSSTVITSDEIQNLLVIAYKNAISKRRHAFRMIKQICQIEELHNRPTLKCCLEYRQKIIQEILSLSNEAESITEKFCKLSDNPATLTFFYKFRADCKRYVAEVLQQDKSNAANEALEFYDKALKTGLSPDHQVILGVILNKAIHYYEIMGNKQQAIDLIQKTLNAHKNASNVKRPAVITLLSDNLKSWQSAMA